MYLNRIRNLTLSTLVACLLVGTVVEANSVRIFSLSADAWARPRSGAMVASLEPVKLAVAYWESGNDSAVMLSYPGADTGELWVAELRDWLISLGVPSDYILLSPGLQVEDEIRILVGNREELVR